jgi:hypothetical protein
MSNKQLQKFLKMFQRMKIDLVGCASDSRAIRPADILEMPVQRDRQCEAEYKALLREEESVATRLCNKAMLLTNVEALQQEGLLERQAVEIGDALAGGWVQSTPEREGDQDKKGEMESKERELVVEWDICDKTDRGSKEVVTFVLLFIVVKGVEKKEKKIKRLYTVQGC